MGKRRREKTDEEIKRLKKELQCRKEFTPGENEDLECDNYNEFDEEELETLCPLDVDAEATDEPTTPLPIRPRILSEIHDTNLYEGTKSVVTETGAVQDDENAIPSEILAILGVANTSEECFGTNIPKEIAERWGRILIEGLQKEQKESLLIKTLTPENVQLSKAPKLNVEVESVLNEPIKNEDKRLEKMQNQLGSGIAGLANLTADLIRQQDLDKMNIIKRLSEINQILLNLHYEESTNGRRLIIPMLDKSFINIIQGVKRDKYLFGDNLGENIKTTKLIEKSSLQIKKSFPQQPSTFRRPATSALQGNARVPPRQASGPGTARAPPAQARYYQPLPRPAARRQPPGPRRPPPPSQPQDRRTRR